MSKSKIHTLCKRRKSDGPKLGELETPLALFKQEMQLALLKQEILIEACNEKRSHSRAACEAKRCSGGTKSSSNKRTEGDGITRLCWEGEGPYASVAHWGKIQQTWAQRQKDDSRGMAYKDPAFPWKEIQGIWITLGTGEPYRGGGGGQLESREVYQAEAGRGKMTLRN